MTLWWSLLIIFVITDNFCYVKDNVENLIMLQGKVEKGLYRLLFVSSAKPSISQLNQSLITHIQSVVSIT